MDRPGMPDGVGLPLSASRPHPLGGPAVWVRGPRPLIRLSCRTQLQPLNLENLTCRLSCLSTSVTSPSTSSHPPHPCENSPTKKKKKKDKKNGRKSRRPNLRLRLRRPLRRRLALQIRHPLHPPRAPPWPSAGRPGRRRAAAHGRDV